LTKMTDLGKFSAEIPDDFEGACRAYEPEWGLLPEALVAEAEHAEAMASLDEASAQTLPTLSLEGTAARALNAETHSGEKNDLTAMLILSMPFYQGGGLQAQKRAASHALSAGSEAINNVRLTAGQSLAEARNQAAGFQQRTNLLSERVDSIELARDLYQ